MESTSTTSQSGIAVTTAGLTLIDLAACMPPGPLESAINEADRLELITPERLRSELDSARRRPGLGALRTILDRHTFRLTDSELERRMLRLVKRAGLSMPEAGVRVNGFKVDFLWPELGLVVETDGLRYHRTPSQQTRDRRRDQAHAAAGLTPLRFSHAQVRFDADYVAGTLAAVVGRLPASPPAS